MKTELLFYKDAYIKEFKALVLSCEKTDKGYKVLLDKTAFFFEGGGQPCDVGTIDNVTVSYVENQNEEIYHYTENPLEVGKTVTGKIDFERRFAFMQNHTGEHIVSGIVNLKYGFDNVGFHLNEEFVTLDFNGILNRNELNEIEIMANRSVFDNRNVRAYFPNESELSLIKYRSKKELTGDIRIVDIDGVDVCACCAPHVSKTGEIGIIKLLDFEKLRGGTRIYMKCGKYALSDYQNTFENLSKIANGLSSKRESAFDIFNTFKQKAEDEKRINTELKKRLITVISDTVDEYQSYVFAQDFDMKDLQVLSDLVCHKYNKTFMAVSNAPGGLFFAICGNECDTYFNNLKAHFKIRGGGRNGMITGVIETDVNSLKSFLES